MYRYSRSGNPRFNPSNVTRRIYRDLSRLKRAIVYISGEFGDVYIEVSRRTLKVSLPPQLCADRGRMEEASASLRRARYIYPEVSVIGRLKSVMEDKKLTVILSSIVQALILLALFRIDQANPFLLIILGVLLASISIGDAIISSMINRDAEKRASQLQELESLSQMYPQYKTASIMLSALIMGVVESSCSNAKPVLNIAGFILRLKRSNGGVYEYRIVSQPGILRLATY